MRYITHLRIRTRYVSALSDEARNRTLVEELRCESEPSMNLARLMFVVTLLCSPSAFAGSGSASHYLPECRLSSVERLNAADDVIKAAHCGGMLYALISSAPLLEQPAKFCPPTGIRVSQVAQTVVRYIESVPQRQNEPFIALALEGMRHAWPCR